jgi:hypothetical protein
MLTNVRPSANGWAAAGGVGVVAATADAAAADADRCEQRCPTLARHCLGVRGAGMLPRGETWLAEAARPAGRARASLRGLRIHQPSACCSIAVTCNESECLTDRSGEMSFEHSVTEVHGH